MSELDTPPEVERRRLTYATHDLPWYIHVLWVSFWVFAIWYLSVNMIPAMRLELASPP